MPSGSGTATFGATIIDDRLHVSAFTDIDHPLFGVTTGVFDVPIEGGTVTIPRGILIGSRCPRTSYGTIAVTPAPDQSP